MSLEEQRFSFLYKITNCYRQILTLTCESLFNILIEYLADIMIKYENWINFQPGDLTPSGIKNTRSQLARGDSCYLGNWQVTKPSVLYLEGGFL